MSYTIHKSDGTTLVSVPENDVVDNITSISLIGRGVSNFGTIQSESFVHILENFANTSPPQHPLQGQLWFDKGTGLLNVYKAGSWVAVGAGSGSGTGISDAGGAISISLNTSTGPTSIVAMVAGGQVICVSASKDIAFSDLPATISVANFAVPFAARFPDGLQAGVTMATDVSDYIYDGHQPNSDQAIFTGGGTPFAASTFCDLGTTCVSLNISNNVIVSVFSQAIVPQSGLPANFTVNGMVMPFAASFSNGLHAGLTMADGMSVNIGGTSLSSSSGGVSLSTVNSLVSAEATARASALNTLQTNATTTYAKASDLVSLISTFETKTGQSSLASAVDWLVATSRSGTAGADFTAQIQSEITNSVTGASSFADALSKMNTGVTESVANATAITDIKSKFVTGTGAVDFATAVTQLSTYATDSQAASSAVTSLSSQLTSTTGQTTTATAIQSIYTAANTGSAGWSVVLNGAGNVAGLSLNAGGSTKSNFTVQVEDFLIAPQTGAAVVPFRVTNNAVYMDNAFIRDLTIGTQKFRPSAINKITTYATPADQLLHYGLGVPVANNIHVVKQDDASTMRLNFDAILHCSNSFLVSFYITRCPVPNTFDSSGQAQSSQTHGVYTTFVSSSEVDFPVNYTDSNGNVLYVVKSAKVTEIAYTENNVPAGDWYYTVMMRHELSNSGSTVVYAQAGSTLELAEIRK